MLEQQQKDIEDLCSIFSMLEVRAQVKKLDWGVSDEEVDIIWNKIRKVKVVKKAKKKGKTGTKIQKDSLHMLVKSISMMNKIESGDEEMYDKILEVNVMLKAFVKDGI